MGLGWNARNILTGRQRDPSIPGDCQDPVPPIQVPLQHGDPKRNDGGWCGGGTNDVENQTITNAFDHADFERKKQEKFDIKMRDNSDPASDIPV